MIDVFRQIPYTKFMPKVLAQVNISDIFTPATSFSSFGDLVTIIVKDAFVLAGVISFVILVLGGFGVIMGAGSGDPKRLEKGKQAIAGAVIGLIIVIGSYWIVQLIELISGVSLLNPKL